MVEVPNRSYVPFITEVGTARSCCLSEPDTAGDYPDNKYKTEIVLPEADVKRLKKEMMEMAKDVGLTKPQLPITTGKDGLVSIRCRSPKKKPLLVDAKKQPIPEGIAITNGSKIIIAGVFANYEKGISAWPDVVQVLELYVVPVAEPALDRLRVQEGFDVRNYRVPPKDGDHS